MKKKLKMGIISAIILGFAMSASGVQAATSYTISSLKVPGINGSAYTTARTKNKSGDGYLNATKVSGGKGQLDARMEKQGTWVGSWARHVKTGEGRVLSFGYGSGTGVKVHFSSDLLSGAVTISGSWYPDGK